MCICISIYKVYLYKYMYVSKRNSVPCKINRKSLLQSKFCVSINKIPERFQNIYFHNRHGIQNLIFYISLTNIHMYNEVPQHTLYINMLQEFD